MKKKYIFTALWTTCLRISWAVGATFDVPNGDVQALREAIAKANASQESNIINLAVNGIYTFTGSYWEIKGNEPEAGAIALPSVQEGGQLTINGNGSLLKRDNAASHFRFVVLGSRSNLKINQLNFENGYSDFAGGAIVLGYQANLQINNCKFQGNYAGASQEYGGGAIYSKSLSKLSIVGCEFKSNRAGNNGGAIYSFLSGLTIENSKFVENQCVSDKGRGGAIYANGANGDEGKIRLFNSLWVMNGAALNGGAVLLVMYNQEKAQIDKCIFSDNKVWGQQSTGGALWATADELDIPLQLFEKDKDKTQLELLRCVFSNNTAVEAGGAIWLGDGQAQIMQSMISHNRVGTITGIGGYGGGIYAQNQSIKLHNSTVTNNYAGTEAGGIFAATNAKIWLNGTTVAYNMAATDKNENCGAIYTNKSNPKNIKLSVKAPIAPCTDNLLMAEQTIAAPNMGNTRQQTVTNALRDIDVIRFEGITQMKTPRFRRWVASIFPSDTNDIYKKTMGHHYADKLEQSPAAAWQYLSQSAQKKWREQLQNP